MATIPKRVSERLMKETRRFQRILRAAKDRDINESDTVIIVTDMLAAVFGFLATYHFQKQGLKRMGTGSSKRRQRSIQSHPMRK
jgi:hypothetical protein